jgi:leader peptidase (prepilin peptidase)/N-methyltransferase
MVIIGIWLWMQPIVEINPLLTVLLIAYFMLIIVVDLEHRLILHPVSLAGGVLCIGVGVQLHGILPTIFGGAAGTAIMFGLYMLGRVFVGYLTKARGEEIGEEALGFGDVILGGVLGMLLGWPGIIAGLILAVVLAGIISLLYLAVMFISRRDLRNLTIAYGPYLVISAFLLVFVL